MKIGNQKNYGGMGRQNVRFKRNVTFGQKFSAALRWIILIAIIVFAIWSQNNFIIVKDYVYTDVRVPKTFTGYTIVHISDIHNKPMNLVSKVKSANPDVILVSGGFTDSDGEYNASVKALNKLANIADTYCVFGDNDSKANHIQSKLDSNIIVIENDCVDIKAPKVDVDDFIDKYIGKQIQKQAKNGEESALKYIAYTKDELEADRNAIIRVSGVPYEVNNETLIDDVYSVIGTDKSIFQILLANRTDLFKTLQIVDVDLYLSGQTHGRDGVVSGYKSGVYAEHGTTMFVNPGIGNLDEDGSRFLNYPEVTKIVLSDGAIKDYNPLEKLLMYFMPDVKTRFDDDEGFKTYTYTYEYGREN